MRIAPVEPNRSVFGSVIASWNEPSRGRSRVSEEGTHFPHRGGNWDGKPGRCEMYCKDLSDEDWRSICDCFEVERCLGYESFPEPLDEYEAFGPVFP